MDKTNRLMSLIDDNTARIEAIDRSLRALVSAKTSVGIAAGVKSAGTETLFGTVSASDRYTVMAYFDGAACSLKVDDAVIGTGTSPIIVSTAAIGTLKLSAARDNARVAVFGAKIT